VRNFDNYLRVGQQIDIHDELRIIYKFHFQYSNYSYRQQDSRHEDKFFDYGYLGKFQTWKMPTYELGSTEIDGVVYDNVYLLNSWDRDTLYTFQNLNYNPEAANFTEAVYDLFPDPGNINMPFGNWRNEDDLRLNGGLLNGDLPQMVYQGSQLWNNPGTMNGYYEEMKEKFRGTFFSEIKFRDHTINLGFEYLNRTERFYALDANELWTGARMVTNYHLQELDLDNPIPIYNNQGIFQDTILYYRKYQASWQFDFDKNLRQKLGLPIDGLEYILTDSYDMVNNTIDYYDKYGVMHTIKVDNELFSIDMFDPYMLIVNGTVSYGGYDYMGEKKKKTGDPYGFFTDGSIEPYNPSYFSAYISDNYNWKFIDLSLGIRMDQFNANQPVLKDPYLMMPAFTVNETDEIQGMPVNHPSEMGNDYVVYVDNAYNPSKVMGYRDGDTWYNESGNEIQDPEILDAGSGVSPYLKYPGVDWIYSSGWEPDMTFKSYKSVVNILPQVNLTARTRYGNVYLNYNTFTRNPFIFNRFRPDQYWMMNSGIGIMENPDLNPTRTEKLCLGIKPRVFNNFYADISFLMVFYKDLLYVDRMTGAWPRAYTTVRNYSETVQNNNLTLALNYFSPKSSGIYAGSSFTKSFIADQDRQFMEIPDYMVNTYLTFNFGTRGDFVLPGNNVLYAIFENLNLGVYHQYRNGTPLEDIASSSQKYIYTPDFSIINLRVEKGVYIKPLDLTFKAYVWVENLLNEENLFYINPVTGKPNDDGFLSSSSSQTFINNQTNLESYRLLYQLKLNNPAYYGKPRIFRVGLIINL